MKAVIKQIVLQNFKGCKRAAYTFDGRMELFYCLVLQIYLAKDLEDGLYYRERMITFVKMAKKILVINAYAIVEMKK